MNQQSRAPVSGIVLIADDHEVTRFGLVRLLQKSLGASLVLEADNFAQALDHVATGAPVLAILDLDMPGMEGPQTLTRMRRADPALKVVVLSGSARREDILASLAAGAHGYIIKNEGAEVLVTRLRRVLEGEICVPPLLAELGDGQALLPAAAPAAPAADDLLSRCTPRQIDVLHCLERGLTNKEIGRELGLSSRTVKMHVSTLLRIFGVRNRTQAAAQARRGAPPEPLSPGDAA